MKDSPLIFLHIPKTAGTSFRLALANAFGEGDVIYDYGKLSEQTSAIVKHHTGFTPHNAHASFLGNTPCDADALFEALSVLSPRVITGHIWFQKYLMLTSIDNVVSFLRNPVEQVVSHWRHYVKHHDYNRSLEHFCRESGFSNMQSKHLGNVTIELIGHLLITERYAQSLSLFNTDYGTELEVSRVNQNTEKTRDAYEISDVQRALIMKNNQRDIRLYDNAVSLFERRIDVMKNGGEWTYGVCHPVNPKGVINGWAYQRSHLPVEIELLSNGKVVAETQAVDYRPNLNVFRPPRKSCIGFQFRLKQVDPSAQLICRVKSTGQELSPPLRM